VGREYIFHGVQVRATTLYPIVMEQQSGLPHVRNLVASDNPDIMIIIEDFLTLYTTKKNNDERIAQSKKNEGRLCGTDTTLIFPPGLCYENDLCRWNAKTKMINHIITQTKLYNLLPCLCPCLRPRLYGGA